MGSDSHKVDFEPIGKRVEVPAGVTLLDAARQAGIGLASVCGGEGTCGRCRVAVMAGQVSPPVVTEVVNRPSSSTVPRAFKKPYEPLGI